jgi:hypothetical protein
VSSPKAGIRDQSSSVTATRCRQRPGQQPLHGLGENGDNDNDLSINILPGNIKDVGLGKKALKGRTGQSMVNNAHVRVDGCGGQVAVRFFATVTIDTDTSDDTVNVYGNILTL